jgi:O-antigen/teichoic acid export membrane protein
MLLKARGPGQKLLAQNVVARVFALASLGTATIFVAHVSGAAGVGVFALLRVLPGLVGVLVSGGLPSAVGYFLARQNDRRLRPTIIAMTLASGAIGALAWRAGTAVISRVFFGGTPQLVIAVAGITVFTQMLVAVSKGCAQGIEDMVGANRVIVLEEFTFLPVYGVLWIVGVRGWALLLAGLVGADLLTACVAWRRLARRGFFANFGWPSLEQTRQIWSYGMRGQIGGAFALVNLRLDFVLLGVFASTAVVGSYAVASKFAELLRLPSLALTYVLYPQFAREAQADRASAAQRARRLLLPALAVTVVAAIPAGILAEVALPLLYGRAFQSAVLPAQILLVGLCVEGAAGVMIAYLYGIGRPGLNSLALGAGAALTVLLDILLIPRFGAVGAAVASSAAYLTSTAALGWFFYRHTRSAPVPWRHPQLTGETS